MSFTSLNYHYYYYWIIIIIRVQSFWFIPKGKFYFLIIVFCWVYIYLYYNFFIQLSFNEYLCLMINAFIIYYNRNSYSSFCLFVIFRNVATLSSSVFFYLFLIVEIKSIYSQRDKWLKIIFFQKFYTICYA